LTFIQKSKMYINHAFYAGHFKFQDFLNPLQLHPEIEIHPVSNGTG
jgi:hypothetical protein